MVDASGNRLVDASANPLQEAGFPVTVIAGGLVRQAVAGSNPFQDLIDWLSDASGFGEALALQPVIQNMSNGIALFLANWQKLVMDTSAETVSYDGSEEVGNYPGWSLNKLLAAIGSGEITWPTEPPSWYTAPTEPDLSGIAGDVWNENIDAGYMTGNTALIPARYVMQGLHWAAEMYAGYTGIPIPERPYFVYVMSSPLYAASDIGLWNESGFPDLLPTLDLSLVQAGDTVLSYLEREYPSFDWSTAGPGEREAGGNVWLAAGMGLGWFRCTLTDADLRVQAVPDQISEISVTVTGTGAPVWPGASGVTLGTPVALTSQLHLTGAMDGVIVAITTPPTRTGLYEVGGAPLDYGQGRIAFETDDGDIEPWQYLGFRAAIYTPKSMAHAAGVRFQMLAGAAGTVTPWTVST